MKAPITLQPLQNCLVDRSIDSPAQASAEVPESRWIVVPGADPAAQGLELVQTLGAVGLPWLEANSVLRNAIPRVPALKASQFYPESERQALRALAAPLGLAPDHVGAPP